MIEGAFGFLEVKDNLQEENIYTVKTSSPQIFHLMWFILFIALVFVEISFNLHLSVGGESI